MVNILKLRRRAALALGLTLAGFSAGAHAEAITVGIDMTKPIHLEREASSIVIGNPAIADLHVQNGKLVFVLGRSFGATNLVALDAEGREIANIPVTVTSARAQNVTLQRGPDGQVSYACAGRCEPALMPGDAPDRYKSLLEAVTTKTALGDSVAEASSKSR